MYLISACLCGVNCKYNGKNNLKEEFLNLLKTGEAILVCPEQLGGLTTPRCPAEIVGSTEEIINLEKGKVLTKEGKDITQEFLRGAKETLKIAKKAGIKKSILKEGSPSCGCNFIYDGSFSGNKIRGEGITAKILKDAGIDVISDEDFLKECKR